INGHAVFQAKGHYYSLPQLLGDDIDRAMPFLNGDFATVYLSPRDYHRVHMPIKGTLKEMIFVPGKLFSVNNRTAETVNGLFARNERVVAIFDTEIGPVAMVLVGAMIVASIETVWAGCVAPVKPSLEVTDYTQAQQKVVLERGAEMGRFKLGSTVIMVFPPNKVKFRSDLKNGTPVKMGEHFADFI
ncbi:MAG TPA: archaetidylserine decarboxylase, partial [Pseudomonadales bacterium]|nr:archaetidylserine decarboxylase [Pseudomonadales bacterium]